MNSIFVNGLQILGDNCPYVSRIDNLLFDETVSNNNIPTYFDGEFAGNSRYESRNFTITVTTTSCNGLTLVDNVRRLMRLKHALSKGIIEVVCDIVDFGKIVCYAQKESIITDEHNIMNVSMHMCDPFVYMYDYKILELEPTIDGGFSIPSEFTYDDTTGWFKFTETYLGNSGEIVNDGFKVSYPIITVTGDVNGAITFKNATTNEILCINNVHMNSDDKLIINCDPYNRFVKLNNNNHIMYKAGNFISLCQGANEIMVSYNGHAIVEVKFREVY